MLGGRIVFFKYNGMIIKEVYRGYVFFRWVFLEGVGGVYIFFVEYRGVG